VLDTIADLRGRAAPPGIARLVAVFMLAELGASSHARDPDGASIDSTTSRGPSAGSTHGDNTPSTS
jgi:hypothetical protein